MTAIIRRQTRLEDVEYTPFAHRYLIKRPVVKDVGDSRDISLQTTRNSGNGPDDAQRGPISESAGRIDNPMVEKRRFELFIDLIWVGIIGNLAEHYSEQAFTSETTFTVGEALGEFILLFLMATRMWKNLQEFMSKYHTNDFVERLFLICYLALAMLFGNSAPYLLDASHPSNAAVIVYLTAQGSITLIESFYSIFLQQQQRGILIRLLIVGVPTAPIYIASCFFTHNLRSTLISIAIILQFMLSALVETPILERLLSYDPERTWDADHWVERIQDFFIIILGEAVLNLIRGSPLGVGLSVQAGAGILALCQYYMISGLFFNGDSSRKYIHAVKRQYWRKNLYMMFHSVVFFSALTLGVSVLYLVEHAAKNAVKPTEAEGLGEEEFKEASDIAYFVFNAKWSAAISLTGTVLCLSAIALLNRSLDPPKTLMVTNRYIRLAPRILLMAVVLCLPLVREMQAIVFLGIIAILLSVEMIWELSVSLERSGGIVEP